MKKVIALTAALFCISVLSSEAFAGSRAMKKFGFTVGLNNDPSVNLWGVNGKFNVLPWLQAHAGWGTGSGTTIQGGVPATFTINSFGAGARLYLPNWDFSPYVGFAWTSSSISGTASILGQSLGANLGSFSSFQIPFGLDWQTKSGLTIGLGGFFYLSPSELTSVIKVLPSFYLGWFF